MARTVSVLLGFYEGPDGQRRRAYRALVPLVCAHCSGPIERGDIFARKAPHAPGSVAYFQARPHCSLCLPLRPLDQALGDRR